MKRIRMIGVAMILSLVAIAAVAQTNMPGFPLYTQATNSAAYVEFDRLVEVMSQIIDPVREAYYAASQGCNAPSSEEMDLYAQMVLNILEGPESPLFDETLDVPVGCETGIMPVVKAFAFTDGWYDPEEATVQQKETLERELEHLQQSFNILSQRVQHALEEGITFVEKRLRVAMVCSLLDARQTVIGEFLADFGYEIRLSPTDLLQAAIDGARDGSTLYLWPRTYAEAVVITKNLTLIGATIDTVPLFETTRVIYGSVIDPPTPVGNDVIGVSVESDSPISVTLRNLTIADAAQGITVSRSASVLMENVTVRDSGTAIQALDNGYAELSGCEFRLNNWVIHTREGGSVVGSDCVFSDNRKAVAATFSSSCSLTNCLIERCGVPDDDTIASAGVISAYCSDVILERCIIRDNYGRGVLLGGGEASTLHMTDCSLTNNEVGLSLTHGGCNPDPNRGPDEVDTGDSTHGTISGWSNHIPDSGETDGNRSVSIEYYYPHKLDPSFLLEPKPEDS